MLAVQFYREAKGVELPGYLKDQLRRAALSSDEFFPKFDLEFWAVINF